MLPDLTNAGPARRPWLFWPALLVAVAIAVGGAIVAVRSYGRTRGPEGAVRGYFESLQDGDAAAALGFGDLPPGPRTLLTDAVLREQRRVARIVDLQVGPVRRTGDRSRVRVSYALRYPNADSLVTTDVGVHESGGDWRLDAVAVRTRLTLESAGQRASVLGRQLPTGAVLAFPGAPPIRFDSGYLALDPDIGIVPGATTPRTYSVTVSAAGRSAALRAVLAAVRGCLAAARPATTCPLPTERYLPGSVHGTVTGEPSDVDVSLTATQLGTLDVTADVPVTASTYRRLDFYNRVSTGRGRLTLAVHAVTVAHDPLVINWLQP